MGATVRFSFRVFFLAGLIADLSLAGLAQSGRAKSEGAVMNSPTDASASFIPDNPVADSKAIVTVGNARFTILTPQLIRMEWSADGKF